MSKSCTIIIPCYNEGNRILSNEFLAFLEINNHFSFVFVDDGSSDNTFSILQKLAQHSKISCLRLDKNKGKAEAVRYGINHTIKKGIDGYVGFLDADLAIPLEELERLYRKLVGSGDVEFVYSSKNTRLNHNLETKFKRVFVGRTLSKMVKWSLKIDVYDTQCGCKIMTKKVAEISFKDEFISSWLFDIEIFWRLIKAYGRSYISTHTSEIPLQKLLNRGDSKVKMGDLIRLPMEFLRIHQFYKK